MRFRVVNVLVIISLSALLIIPKSKATEAVPLCTLCILEFSTTSILGEEYDFVTIGNSTISSISLSSVQLQYLNSDGVYDSKISLSGTLSPGQTKTFVSNALKTFNPSLSSLPMGIFSGGGSLRLIKVLTSSTTIYDTVGWGSANTYEGQPINVGDMSKQYIRLTTDDGVVIDTDDNQYNFYQSDVDCSGLRINEIQPFATDDEGRATESWVEISHSQKTTDECFIASSLGNYYQINSSFYGDEGSLFSVSTIQIDDEIIYLQLPNPSGQVAIAHLSNFGSSPVILPIISTGYNDLDKGQSSALFEEYGSEIWKLTYSVTRDSPNTYISAPIIVESGDENACSDIYINEIVPNPEGADTGFEWVEVINQSDAPNSLEQCVISIESTKYYFLSTNQIGPSEIQRYYDLIDEDGSQKSISLRNTDPTYVSMSRLYQQELEVLQSFIYESAPEGMSYSRFDEGWAWTYSITPGLSNIYLATKPVPVITEFKGSFATASTATKSTAAKKSSTTNTKTTSTKSLATKAKATTGAKNTSERDIYEDPSAIEDSGSTDYIFVVLGVVAIMYAIYEYRSDIQNYFIKRKRNQKIGV